MRLKLRLKLKIKNQGMQKFESIEYLIKKLKLDK